MGKSLIFLLALSMTIIVCSAQQETLANLPEQQRQNLMSFIQKTYHIEEIKSSKHQKTHHHPSNIFAMQKKKVDVNSKNHPEEKKALTKTPEEKLTKSQTHQQSSQIVEKSNPEKKLRVEKKHNLFNLISKLYPQQHETHHHQLLSSKQQKYSSTQHPVTLGKLEQHINHKREGERIDLNHLHKIHHHPAIPEIQHQQEKKSNVGSMVIEKDGQFQNANHLQTGKINVDQQFVSAKLEDLVPENQKVEDLKVIQKTKKVNALKEHSHHSHHESKSADSTKQQETTKDAVPAPVQEQQQQQTPEVKNHAQSKESEGGFFSRILNFFRKSPSLLQKNQKKNLRHKRQ